MPKPGPLFTFPSIGGVESPFYALRFDKFGALISPETTQDLIEKLESGEFTDVIVCAHGWNNIWKTALENYRGFIDNLGVVHRRTGVKPKHPYRPLAIGIFWPSTSLVLPWEQPPRIAGGDPAERPALDAWEVEDQQTIAELLPDEQLEEFYALTDAAELDAQEAERLAELLLRISSADDEDLHDPHAATVADLLAAWKAYEAPEAVAVAPGRGGVRVAADEEADEEDDGEDAAAPAAPVAAGSFPSDPRQLLRLTTVRVMKDRAGKVGARGVGSVLRRAMTAAPQARFHLVGHSYGARLLLNAVSRPVDGPLPGSVRSLLLLQPAVNHLCFADALPGFEGTPPGGYHEAIAKVELPILTTVSVHDFPLRKVFHHALIRPKDIGEILIAGGDDPPPSIYAALGGYGPRGIEPVAKVAKVEMMDPAAAPSPGDFYDLRRDGPEIIVLDGDDKIDDHGDVVTTATAWALLNLIAQE
ncbi:hypothetical protein [Microbacterium sp. SS28]|uniref:hypothetical protein n=1 Tax=Microbacterium sp. SS28 TaxID=2919948 RepID=UPI001FAAEDDB|nr:hypothetical protein [Microbacterium sp. SS28]